MKSPLDRDAAASLGTPADTSLLDLAVLSRLNDDLGRESVVDLMDLFRTESERRRHRIEAAVTARDAPAACHEAHALKGSALTFGACRLGALALRMEQAGRSGDLEGLTSDLPELARLTAETQAALSRLFSESGDHGDPESS
ncbi:HPt (histidine-containing phosphotransfer) domain-containing protein [Thiocapsa rosea]|uniref:HPt (Histidine-containing phosphotransfer) domain-containing protein n=2 Tax=Thiocapsa rosea TaxID=69360 RepID=A0A495VE97_9GAMM|nr:HPt (histidine-containing phosphotransfer) domain-containing protein [Thiocapsa rosea]